MFREIQRIGFQYSVLNGCHVAPLPGVKKGAHCLRHSAERQIFHVGIGKLLMQCLGYGHNPVNHLVGGIKPGVA